MMPEPPESRNPRKRKLAVLWAAGLLGVGLIDVAVQFILAKSGGSGWLFLAAGLALILFVLYAARNLDRTD